MKLLQRILFFVQQLFTLSQRKINICLAFCWWQAKKAASKKMALTGGPNFEHVAGHHNGWMDYVRPRRPDLFTLNDTLCMRCNNYISLPHVHVLLTNF